MPRSDPSMPEDRRARFVPARTGSSLSPLPFVLVNMAMTADGKIATGNRAVGSFGSERDREHLLELRAGADAVLAGARTVDGNPVTLGPGSSKFRRQRLASGLTEYNLRVIVSGTGTINAKAEVFARRFSPLILLTTERTSKHRFKELAELVDEVKVCGCNEIDFVLALRWLRQKWRVKRLLCEGGGELNAALFRDGLVDELHLTWCPFIFGGREAPTVADGLGVDRLAQADSFQLHSMQAVENEMFLVYRRAPRRLPGGRVNAEVSG
jgi:2,5-diamino-6-(ribosylamino)-4(3H)-pyrimidinone 5'-phosphate reductase